MTDDEYTGLLEACGRATGFALAIVLNDLAAGRPVPAGKLSEALDGLVYDNPGLDPRTALVVQGMIHGIDVALGDALASTL